MNNSYGTNKEATHDNKKKPSLKFRTPNRTFPNYPSQIEIKPVN